DGWRHLRFLLVHSPTHLFVIPGAVMTVLGLVVALTVVLQIDVFGRSWDLHTMVVGALAMIIGVQVIGLGLCAHAYGAYFMGEKDPWFDRMRARFRLEHGLLLGSGLTLAGLAAALAILVIWIDRDFGTLSEERLAVLAATLIIVGLQVFFVSFLLSILGLRRRG
ncbi:MAG TPA: glycosyltransferase family 2 protein, partial [Solirubrobacteraceae bacterium]|nr:glycosyltransferase family 2 protein [Solirubrobacteraceae bacterium]